jgi:hypothetical protein
MAKRKNSGGGSSLLTLGLVAVGGYVVYEMFFANSLPADVVALPNPQMTGGSQLASGQSATMGTQTLTGPGYIYYSPSTKLYYVNATAPTTAQLSAYVTLVTTQAAASNPPITPGSTISTVVPAGAPTAPPTTPTGSTLDSLYTAMIALITKDKDPQFTGSGSGLSASAWQFNYYLQLVGPSLSIPDPTVVFGGTPAATGPMTAAAYWAKMAPALQASNAGLAGMGLGMYGGMGAYLQGLGAYRW